MLQIVASEQKDYCWLHYLKIVIENKFLLVFHFLLSFHSRSFLSIIFFSIIGKCVFFVRLLLWHFACSGDADGDDRET